MKILFFTNEYSHPALPPHGGVGTFFKTMSRELVQRGHEVHIYGFSKKEYDLMDGQIRIKFFKQYSKAYPLSELIRSLGSRLGFFGFTAQWLRKERQFLATRLKKYAYTHQIDIIQSFTFNGFTAYWDNSLPLVTRFHGSRGFWHYYLGHKNESLKIAMEKKALQNTPYTVANSYFSKQFIKDYYNVSVARVIQNGIDTNVFAPDAAVFTIPKSIFYIGTLSEAKGVKDLALIFNEVIKRHPSATLNLIGRGEQYWNHLKSEVLTKEASQNTNYLKHIPFHQLPKKLSEAVIIAVPSRGETFGFTIVEAMALEKITIVSAIPVADEIISHGKDGFIAKNNDEFIQIIQSVFDDPDAFKELRKKARQKVLEKFDQERMVSESIAYFHEILSENQHESPK